MVGTLYLPFAELEGGGVTRDGCERLTGAAPIDLDETEKLMTQPSNFNLGCM